MAPARVAVGRDIRLSSPGLADALCRGLMDSGVDVDDIGVCGTEGVYFADVRRPLRRRHHGDRQPQPAGLQRHEIRARAIETRSARTPASRRFARAPSAARFRAAARKPGVRRSVEVTAAYVEHLLSYVDVNKLVPPENRGERGQRRRRPDPRSARAASAVRAHQDPPRARWTLSERRAESRCSRTIVPPPSRRFAPRRASRARLGRGLRPLLLL